MRRSKFKGVPKFEDAIKAGTSSSLACTLIVTAEDSINAMVCSGLSVIGRDKYGVFLLTKVDIN
jgi:DNA topoisomerase-2